MNGTHGRILGVSGGLLLATMVTAVLSGCATLGDPGPAICHAPDGTMVPLRDPKCPEDVRAAMQADTPAPVSIDQQMNNETYNAKHGLVPGDFRLPLAVQICLAMEQSGGMMNGPVSGVASHFGGSLGGVVTTNTYDLTDASSTSGGPRSTLPNFFALEPASGTATVDALLTGTGQLVKSGASPAQSARAMARHCR